MNGNPDAPGTMSGSAPPSRTVGCPSPLGRDAHPTTEEPPMPLAARRASAALASAFAPVLAFALVACDAPTAADPARHAAGEPAPAAAVAADPSPPPVSTMEELPGGVFRFTSVAVLDAPEGAVWAKVHNIQKLVEMVLPGIASDFQWLDGGGPSKVPSRYQFVALGSPVVEEVTLQDKKDKVLEYRLVTPALGIQTYLATVALDPIDNTHTRVTYTRLMTFDDPASAASFAALFEQEIAALQAHFAK